MLSLSKALNIELPCGIGSGCETITQDPRSVLLGIPIAYFGVAGYGLLTLISLLRVFGTGRHGKRLHAVGYLLSGIALIVSIALTVFSLRVLHSFCTWCLSSAVVVSLLFVSHAWEAARGAGEDRRWSLDLPFTAILLFAYCFGLVLSVDSLKKQANVVQVNAQELHELAEPDLLPERTHLKGPKAAKAIVVMFGDLTCPVCRHAYQEISELMKTRHDFKLAFRHLPLTIHDMSKPAALISEMASEKGHFWDFVDACYNENLEDEGDYARVAAQFGCPASECLHRLRDEEDPVHKIIAEDRKVTDRLGLHSTPSCFIVVPGYYPEPIHSNGIAEMLDRNKALVPR